MGCTVTMTPFAVNLSGFLPPGHPVTRSHLATVLQMTAEQVSEVFECLSDLEVDQSGNVVGWGLTLIPTPHRFQINGKLLYTCVRLMR